MIRTLLRLFGAIAVLAAMLCGAAAAPLALHRGVGLHDLLNWSPLEKDGSYRWPPYRSETEWLSQYRPLSDWPPGNELERIRALGFDFVRLTVDPGPLLDSAGDPVRRKQALDVLSDTVRNVVAAGLNVVFNLHANSQVPRYGMDVVNGAADSPGIAGYEAMAADVAAMLAPIGVDRVAFEPFNEPAHYPCDDSGSDDWQRIMAATVKAIRAVSADLTIVATGACGGSITGLTDLDPSFDDPAILYSFHFYEPHAFTHQRDDDRDGWWSGFPWPSDARGFEEVIEALRARMQAAGATSLSQNLRLAAARERLRSYEAGGWGLERMAARFDEAANWADRHGIPTTRLFMGEFGVILITPDGRMGALDEDRLRYLRAARGNAERYGIPWSIWEYSNPYGMSVIVPEGPAVPDPALMTALGL